MEFCTAPQMIPCHVDRKRSHRKGVCSFGRDFNFYPEQKQAMTDHILCRYDSHDKLISSSDRLQQKLCVCVVIGFAYR